VLGLVPRLRDFGAPRLRPVEALDGAERRALEHAFDALPSGASLLVADDGDHGPVGVAYAHPAIDYFTGESHGHLAILAVAEGVEGRGVGRALMAAVERWAIQHHYRYLALNVFAGNVRARHVYERGGFEPDTLRYVKSLEGGSA
jgi:GNAT superfamily N-acetyltransferase